MFFFPPRSGVLAMAPFYLSIANVREEGDWTRALWRQSV